MSVKSTENLKGIYRGMIDEISNDIITSGPANRLNDFDVIQLVISLFLLKF